MTKKHITRSRQHRERTFPKAAKPGKINYGWLRVITVSYGKLRSITPNYGVRGGEGGGKNPKAEGSPKAENRKPNVARKVVLEASNGKPLEPLASFGLRSSDFGICAWRGPRPIITIALGTIAAIFLNGLIPD